VCIGERRTCSVCGPICGFFLIYCPQIGPRILIIKIHDYGTTTTLAKNVCILLPTHFSDKIVIHEFDIIELYGE
jgi:hypothetical protein